MSARWSTDELREIAEEESVRGQKAAELLEARGAEE